jgi:hypothetical protein
MLSLSSAYGIRQIINERRRKKKQRELKVTYNRIVLQNKLSIEHSEIIGNRAIGLDRKNKKLLVIDHNNTSRKEMCIPLIAISSTKIIAQETGMVIFKKFFLN